MISVRCNRSSMNDCGIKPAINLMVGDSHNYLIFLLTHATRAVVEFKIFLRGNHSNTKNCDDKEQI